MFSAGCFLFLKLRELKKKLKNVILKKIENFKFFEKRVGFLCYSH